MDSTRFTELYESVYKDLYRFALYTMRNASDAEDAVSESVLAAWEKRDQLRDQKAFKAWIFQITANTCRKLLKAASRTQPTEHQAMKPDTQTDSIDSADAAAVRELFFKLKDEDRLIVALSVFGGYRSEEIGSMLSINANTVRSRRKRAFDRIAKQ